MAELTIVARMEHKMRNTVLRTRLFALLLIGLTIQFASAQTVDVSAHGRRVQIGTGDSQVTLLYLRGTAYEMGYAHGKLCSDEVKYMAHRVTPVMMIGLRRPKSEIDAIWTGYTRHMNPDYLQEIKGLADGSGVAIEEIERMLAIPDISEWHCTFFAATGKATKDHDLIQIRALDYETRVGIQKYPAIIISKPEHGVPFMNVGWLGQVGMITGMNAAGIAMSEIGDDWDLNTDSFDGRPLNFVMRDVVQYTRTLDQAVNSVKDGTRTTSLLYCISSAKDNQALALKTSHAHCFVYSSDNLPFKTQPGLVYMSMGMSSNWNTKIGNCLNELYGKIDVAAAQDMMRDMHTGSLHAVVFRPATGEAWVANATSSKKAFDMPYNRVSIKESLADPFFAN